MKLHVMSDIHLEFRNWETFAKQLNGEADALVLAGDIYSLRFSDQALKVYSSLCEKYPKVFFVPGNHEYYKTDTTSAGYVLNMLGDKIKNLTVLETGEVHVYNGKRFLGDTMWFKDDPFNAIYAAHFTDFRLIKKFNPWVYQRNDNFRSWLDKECKVGDIVITHHIPSRVAVGDDFTDNDYNRFFVCDVSGTIVQRAPSLWIHGHGHDPIDVELDKTRIFCNPMGYPNEKDFLGRPRNPNFWKRIQIEV